MSRADVPLLLLCGAPGAGKSSVGWEVYRSLIREGVPVAHVDLDGIGYGPPGHSGSFEMKFRNVAAVWRSYSHVGASGLVVSGLRSLEEDVHACAAAVPGSVTTPVVLTVTAEEQRQARLTRPGLTGSVAWHSGDRLTPRRGCRDLSTVVRYEPERRTHSRA